MDPAIIDDYTRELVEKFGKSYIPAILPSDITRGEPGHCYDWSLMQAVLSDEKYLYVEGIASTHTGEERAHGWLTDGVYAFDPTWGAFTRKGKELPFPGTYQGVVIDTRGASEYLIRTGNAGVTQNRTLLPDLFAYIMKSSRRLW